MAESKSAALPLGYIPIRLERPALRATAERHNSQSMTHGQWRAAMRAEGTVERCIRVSRPTFCCTNASAVLASPPRARLALAGACGGRYNAGSLAPLIPCARVV